DEWRRSTPRRLDLLAAAREPPGAGEPVQVTGVGAYPRHLPANTMAFNVSRRLRNGLLAPDGPLPFALPWPTVEPVPRRSTSCSPGSPGCTAPASWRPSAGPSSST
ncbi:hypothetical protein AB0D38_44830, partial [Streptomyces sp. NPDC048279]|uniref:hypothetical protein n=1 Tax=Streptomyces sp. NPDC048279 TaxID=3154714 RepID=UPI00343D86F5